MCMVHYEMLLVPWTALRWYSDGALKSHHVVGCRLKQVTTSSRESNGFSCVSLGFSACSRVPSAMSLNNSGSAWFLSLA